MKNIKLKRLELTNYRNIEHAVYEFNGNSKIVGDNRIGKTNTLEAIYYLLTGYLLNGSSDIQTIKPLSNSRAIVSVLGTFDVDGKDITIEKKYGEEWVKQRNTGDEVLKGHFSELFYNGVKQPTVRDFNALYYEDFGISQSETVKISFIQLLTNPFYIGDLSDSDDWKEIRKFIIDLVGDVSDDDVYKKEPSTLALREEMRLANGRIDQVKKKIDGEIKGLKEMLIADDAKIELLDKVDMPSDAEVEGARLKLYQIDEKISSLRSSSGNKEAEISIKNKIADINVKIAELKTTSTISDESVKLGVRRNELIDKKIQIQEKINDIESKIYKAFLYGENLQDKRKSLLQEYRELNDAKFDVETVCPTCKRPLEQEDIEKARNELISKNKQRLDEILKEGKEIAEEIKTNDEHISTMQSDKEILIRDHLNPVLKEIDEINDQIAIAESKKLVPVKSDEIEKLELEKSKLETELLKIQSDSEMARKETNGQIYELENSKNQYQKVLDDLSYANRQSEEKKRCELERSEHSKSLIQKEQLKDLIQKFTFTKLQLLDSNVSSVFGNIKFQLIKENINGGFDTVCKPYIYDPVKKQTTNVLWKNGSKSEKVATGIAIAEAIKTKLELSDMPYLFDEGGELSEETIKNRLLTNSQIICVKVQDNIASPLVLAL